MTWKAFLPLLPPATAVAVVVVLMWGIRKGRFSGLGAVVQTPAAGFDQIARAADASAARAGRHVRATGIARVRRTVGNSVVAMPAAVFLVVLAVIWTGITVMLVQRTASIILRPLQEAALVGVGTVTRGDLITAYAEAMGIVALTAIAGIVLSESVGLTRHIAFVREMRRFGRLLAFAFGVGLIAFAATAQNSIAQQEMAHLNGLIESEIIVQRNLSVAPLPFGATPDEITTHSEALNQFELTVATPRRAEVETVIGPLGRGSLVPMVATAIDALLAWTFVEALIIIIANVAIVAVSLARVPTILLRAVSYVVLTVAGILVHVFNLPPVAPIDESATVAATQPDPTAPSDGDGARFTVADARGEPPHPSPADLDPLTWPPDDVAPFDDVDEFPPPAWSSPADSRST